MMFFMLIAVVILLIKGMAWLDKKYPANRDVVLECRNHESVYGGRSSWDYIGRLEAAR